MPSTRESCVRVLKKKAVIFKDPLDTLPHVYAAFLLGVLSFVRINNRVLMRDLEKDPWHRRKVMMVVRHLEKKK